MALSDLILLCGLLILLAPGLTWLAVRYPWTFHSVSLAAAGPIFALLAYRLGYGSAAGDVAEGVIEAGGRAALSDAELELMAEGLLGMRSATLVLGAFFIGYVAIAGVSALLRREAAGRSD
jgi:hypothetical protein